MPGRASTLPTEGLPQVTVNEWLTAYHELCVAKEDVVPEGFLTVDEIAKMSGTCRQTASQRVNALHRAGKADRLKLRRMRTGGLLKVVPYYKLSVARSSTS